MTEIDKIARSKDPMPFSPLPKEGNELEILENHPAWHIKINMEEASEVLEYKTPFSYIFCPSSKPDIYVLSYMSKDEIVSHAMFNKEENGKKWHYRNGYEGSCGTLDEMVCRVMHCESHQCRPLAPLPETSSIKA